MRRAALCLLLACDAQRPGPATPAATIPTSVQPAMPATHATASVAAGHFVIRGAEVVGHGRVDLEVRDGRIEAIGTVGLALPEVDARGRFIVPAIVDSHVHLAYLPVGEALLTGGVAAVVDLGAPLAWLDAPDTPRVLRVLASGPMITARRGYPTRDWGADGFGREVGGPNEAAAAVDELVDHGARVIKLPIAGSPVLDERSLKAAVDRAHARGVKVVSHALGDREAALAARVGVDVLGHTPVEPLTEATVAAWSGRACISTLAAFGGAAGARSNLRRLRAAGVAVLYGTDLGNTREAGISGDEIDLLVEAGLDGAAVLAAATATPAAFWSFASDTPGTEGGKPGTLAPGGPASLLVLAADPRMTPRTLATPLAVYISGQLR